MSCYSTTGFLSFCVMLEPITFAEGHYARLSQTGPWSLPHVHAHTHKHIELCFVRQGTGHFHVDESVWPLQHGSLIWLPVDSVHQLINQSADFYMWILSFPPELLSNYKPPPHHVAHIHKTDAQFLDDGFTRLAYIQGNEANEFNAGCQYLASHAQRLHTEAGTESFHNLSPFIADCLSLINHDPSMDGTALANKLSCSRSYLSRLFRKECHISLHDFRNRVRIELFMALHHQYPEQDLLSLALQAGFGSYAQFHRVFSQYHQCSPTVWVHKLPHT